MEIHRGNLNKAGTREISRSRYSLRARQSASAARMRWAQRAILLPSGGIGKKSHRRLVAIPFLAIAMWDHAHGLLRGNYFDFRKCFVFSLNSLNAHCPAKFFLMASKLSSISFAALGALDLSPDSIFFASCSMLILLPR